MCLKILSKKVFKFSFKHIEELSKKKIISHISLVYKFRDATFKYCSVSDTMAYCIL